MAVASPDKDFFQLLRPGLLLLRPPKKPAPGERVNKFALVPYSSVEFEEVRRGRGFGFGCGCGLQGLHWLHLQRPMPCAHHPLPHLLATNPASPLPPSLPPHCLPVVQEFGLQPHQFVDVLALAGDASGGWRGRGAAA